MNKSKYPITSDRRWTITLEYCGMKDPQYIIRFCDKWVDKRATYASAVVRTINAKAQWDGRS
jgi:hypothetical protein